MKKNNQGFTLAELLIVVAIIAVLVAIAIPVFTSRLEQSRETTDIANLRSAYAAGQVAALSGLSEMSGSNVKYPTGSYAYDPNDGDGLTTKGSGAKLGQGTATDGHADKSKLPAECSYQTSGKDYRQKEIVVKFDNSGLTSVKFAD